MDQIPAASVVIPRGEPAVVERHATAVLLLRQLRAPHQQQGIIGELFATDTGKGRVHLSEYPLALCLRTFLQPLTRGVVQQGIAVMKEKLPPLLLVLRIHWPFDLTQRR